MSTLTPLMPVPAATSAPASLASIIINGEVQLPMIATLDAFVEWSMSDDRPERGRFAFLAGTFWVDLMSEQLYSHNQIKTAISASLWQLALSSGLGRYFSDGADFVNQLASLATTPDGVFVSFASLQAGRVVGKPNRQQVGVIRLEGSPDMVLEVLSDSSEDKDITRLPGLYHTAGVSEFWRVDARGDLRFEILRWTPTGYVPALLPDGWWHSEVFGRDFLLTASVDPLGYPQFVLQQRP